MSRKLFLPLILLVVSLSTVEGSQDNTSSPIGTNFWFFGDNQAEWPFVDFFKQSRKFWSSTDQSWDDNRKLSLDSNGYPITLSSGQYATTLLFWDGTHFPSGDYTLLYDGEGTVEVDMGQPSAVTVKSSQPGRIVVTVPPGNKGLRIEIKKTTDGNYVRNIRFIAPGFEATYKSQVFHPLFLEKISAMRCLRFMDWMKANSSKIVNWSERTKPTEQTQDGPSGVALEYLVDLCNQVHADGWFCLPVRGTNECFKQYATYIRDHLDPCLKAYFEFGNECWNGGVQSNVDYLDSIGVKLGFKQGWDAQHHGWARRMTDMLCCIDTVYSGHMDRCVRVLATQVVNTGVLDGLLHFYDGEKHGDVIAVAPYFNGRSLSGGTDVDKWLDSLAADAATTDKKISGDYAIAQAHNMKLVAYESGLDVWPSSYKITESFARQLRFHPRMQTIYTDMLKKWRAGGGTLINQYTFCNPSWGLLEYLEQDTTTAPMYLAALHFITDNPRWWNESREQCSNVSVNHDVQFTGNSQSEKHTNVLTVSMLSGKLMITTSEMVKSISLVSLEGKCIPLTAQQHGASSTFTTGQRLRNGCYIIVAMRNGNVVSRTRMLVAE
jgi:hypothetical protein